MKAMKKWLIGWVIVIVYACAGGLIYAAGNFHYPHIKIWDFGRATEIIRADMREQVYDFYASHIDVVESDVAEKSLALKQRNPDLRTFTYQVDISQCQHEGCYDLGAILPDPPGATENMYLHFAETTTCNFYRPFYNDYVQVTVPGCADPAHPTKESRVQTYIWLDYRYVYNQKNTAFRAMMANRLIAASDAAASNGVFLDEHGPGITDSIGWNPANVTAGGRLLEYPDKRLEEVRNETNADLVQSLAYYKQELNSHNKFVVINGGVCSAGDPLVIAQVKTAGGTVTEMLVRPTVGDGGDGLESLFKGLDESIVAGAMIDLFGSWDYRNEIAGLATWTPGNYSSQVGRWQMWRLAYYYLIREMEGGPGEVYFTPDFPINYSDPAHALDFVNDWMPAYEVNVGLPDGPRNPIYAQGTGSWCESYWGGPIQYTIFSRSFNNGNVLVLLRPKDNSLCNQYGDNSGVVLTLDQPRYLLRQDGTFPAQPSGAITLRQSESAILFVSTAEIPPPVTYTISGTITYNGNGLADVALSGLPGSPRTNASGVYTATVNEGWDGTATPVLAGYTFTPANRPYTNITANQTGQDYTATPIPTYTISGTITHNGSGLGNVVLSGLPGNPATNASGVYTATVNSGWSGTVTPTLSGYTFSPANRAYTNVTANQSGQNYTAEASNPDPDPDPSEGDGGGGGGGGCFIASSGNGSPALKAAGLRLVALLFMGMAFAGAFISRKRHLR